MERRELSKGGWCIVALKGEIWWQQFNYFSRIK